MRLFNVAVTCSVLCDQAIVTAWAASNRINSQTQFISLADWFHITIGAQGIDARLEFFNDANYGPYHGSIIEVISPRGTSRTKRTGFGDFAGIYFRHFRAPNSIPLWTLSISLIYPLIISAILTALWVRAYSRASANRNPIEAG